MCGLTGCSKHRPLGPVDSPASSVPQLQAYGDHQASFGNDFAGTDEFKMYLYKVLPCGKLEQHDIGACPFAHSGEKAARRDLRIYGYNSSACPDVLQSGRCPRGNSCDMAHSVFEYWLHPQRYRTQMCRDGASCTRKVCFFAHSDLELRHVPGTSADASDPFSKAAKFSLSGMKRQKSTSLSQTSPGSAHSCSSRDRSSSGGGSTSSSRAVVQPAYHTQGLDLVPALSMDALSNCSTGSHVYPSNMLRNSSMDVSSGSRKSSWAEYSCNLAGNLDASMLGPAAGLYAVGPLTPPQQPLQSPGGGVPTLDALFNTNSAIPQTITGAVQAGPWTQNTASPTAGPAAVTACLGLPSAAIHSSNSVTDAAAYLQMLSAYQQRSETCRLQAAMADAAATAVAGKLHASCNALGWPENSILPQPANLACGLSAGLATSGLGIADLTGVTWRDLETVPQYPATDLAAPASLALSGFTGGSLNDLAAPSLSNLPLIYQATAGVAAGSQQLPGLRAHELLVAAASAAAQAGLPVGSYPLMGQLQSTLLA